jgi:diguanylate cyclase (GGDEF)-like protein
MGLNASFSAALKARAPSPVVAGAALPPLVLIVDDELGVVSSLADQLRASCQVFTANSGEQALELLKGRDVSLVISDQRMPGMSGADLLAAVRERSPDTVRVMLTGYSDIEAVIGAINGGGVFHYVTKPWRPAEMDGMVRSALEHHRVLCERRTLVDDLRTANASLEQRVGERTAELEARNGALEEANHRIEEMARRDPLTGAYNRRYLGEALSAEVARARRQASPLAAVMLDLDHFKQVNDRYGHAVGDAVLVVSGALLAGRVRPYDVVARYGGEEFVVLLPGASLTHAADMAERLREGFAGLVVPGFPGRVTVSLGVAVLAAQGTGEEMLSRADAALYRAKARGRDRVASEGDGAS